jgi:hypothetical protein
MIRIIPAFTLALLFAGIFVLGLPRAWAQSSFPSLLPSLRVAYPRLADIISGPLPSRLRRVHQPVMSPPSRFSTPHVPLWLSI